LFVRHDVLRGCRDIVCHNEAVLDTEISEDHERHDEEAGKAGDSGSFALCVVNGAGCHLVSFPS